MERLERKLIKKRGKKDEYVYQYNTETECYQFLL